MTFILRKAGDIDIEKVKPYTEELNLDSEDLDPEKFYIAEKDGNLAGFGRYKNYENTHEISTVGVLKNYRNSGVGRIIIEKLIETAALEDEIWLTTVFPAYFTKLGFKISGNIPQQLVLKTERICKKFNKPVQRNVFMKYHRL